MNAYIYTEWGLITVGDVGDVKFGGTIAGLLKSGARQRPIGYVDTSRYPVLLGEVEPLIRPWSAAGPAADASRVPEH